jgi:hypothetical protein
MIVLKPNHDFPQTKPGLSSNQNTIVLNPKNKYPQTKPELSQNNTNHGLV